MQDFHFHLFKEVPVLKVSKKNNELFYILYATGRT